MRIGPDLTVATNPCRGSEGRSARSQGQFRFSRAQLLAAESAFAPLAPERVPRRHQASRGRAVAQYLHLVDDSLKRVAHDPTTHGSGDTFDTR